MDMNSLRVVIETCLTWIGFGVVCGLIAKALVPGRDPGGTFVNFFLGIGGALLGAATYAWAGGERIQQIISPLGFGVAIAGAMFLLVSHRLLSGRLFGRETADHVVIAAPKYTKRRQRQVRYSDVD